MTLRTLLLLAALPTAAAAQQLPPLPPDTLAAACAAPELRHFDFWLGHWSVAPAGAPVSAVSEITRVANGCAIQERYHTRQGYLGTSLNHWDAAAGVWRQRWVDNGGLVLDIAGGLDAEGRMVMEGEHADAQGRTVRDRIAWSALPDGRVRQVWEQSLDGGGSWTTAFDGYYTRVPEE